MSNFLLIGAGFSRNWGGWLAAEAFEYLLGIPNVARNDAVRSYLWRFQDKGGFEKALGSLQNKAAQSDCSDIKEQLNILQEAIIQMFEEMNKVFTSNKDWQFGQKEVEYQIGNFLIRFDAIFTLNQDVFLEHHYADKSFLPNIKQKWNGLQLPGMQQISSSDFKCTGSWAHALWSPLPEDKFELTQKYQPIYKLHGSSNWRQADGQRLLVIGSRKTQNIMEIPILERYASEFRRQLLEPNSKLMIIGYGFRDEHINSVIKEAIDKNLKIFIVAPDGADTARRSNPNYDECAIKQKTTLEESIEKSLIGASRRNLKEIFGNDHIEFRKVMRFFDF